MENKNIESLIRTIQPTNIKHIEQYINNNIIFYGQQGMKYIGEKEVLNAYVISQVYRGE